MASIQYKSEFQTSIELKYSKGYCRVTIGTPLYYSGALLRKQDLYIYFQISILFDFSMLLNIIYYYTIKYYYTNFFELYKIPLR